MTAGKILALVVALVLLVLGGFLAFGGMGYLDDSGETSRAGAIVGAVLAGFGVALAITVLQRRD